MTQRRRIPLDDRGMPVRKQDVPVEDPAGPAQCRCPILDPEEWDGVENDWSDIAFVRAATNAVMGVPLGFDSARAGLQKKAARAGATVAEDAMLLVGSGRFRRPILLEVEGDVVASKGVEHPRGFAFTRLVPAPWGELSRLVDEVSKEAASRYGRPPDATWVWYLTCRLCSRARGFETLIVAQFLPGS